MHGHLVVTLNHRECKGLQIDWNSAGLMQNVANGSDASARLITEVSSLTSKAPQVAGTEGLTSSLLVSMSHCFLPLTQCRCSACTYFQMTTAWKKAQLHQ